MLQRRRVYMPNRSSSVERAREIRETFYDKPAERATPVRWQWPKRMREVGTCEAVMYTSDKWKPTGKFEDYKHIAEGPQRLMVTDGFLRQYGSPGHKLQVVGPVIDLNPPMPDAFAVIAPILGVQTRLYEEKGDDGRYLLPNGNDDGYYQIDIPNAQLGGAEHPGTREKFLLVYTGSGVHCIIVGDELEIEPDGIAG